MKKVLGAALALGLAAGGAQAATVIGGTINVATSGNVVAKFEGQSAGYDSELLFGSNVLFNNHTTPVGTTVSLGYFTAGTVLTFVLHVLNTGDYFVTGPASDNPDGVAHASVTDMGSYTIVGFEDLYGGGDLDYNDNVFSFSYNVIPTVPVPAAGLMLVSALGGMAALRRKRR